MKASAYKQYGDAAILSLVLEALPQIAAEVSAPLAKTDQIVLIGGGNNTTHEVNKLMGTLPPAIQALTGVDLTGFDNGSGPGPLDQRARPRTALSSQSKPVGDELAWSSISLTSSPSPHSAHATPLTMGPLHLH